MSVINADEPRVYAASMRNGSVLYEMTIYVDGGGLRDESEFLEIASRHVQKAVTDREQNNQAWAGTHRDDPF